MLMQLKPQGFMEWSFSIIGFAVFLMLLVTAAYVFLPFPTRYFGVLPMAGSILQPLFIYAALACLIAFVIAVRIKWLGPKIFFLLSIFISLLISIVPMIQLIKASFEYKVNVSVATSLVYKKNKGHNAKLKTVSYVRTTDGKNLQLDIWPADVTVIPGPRPAILKIHGGGWSHGNKSDMSGWNSWLNSLGYHVFDMEYRLSPPDKWLDATADVKCALGWIVEHAQQYNVDTGCIVLMGYSAGAHLALMTAYTQSNELLPASCSVSAVKIKGVIDIYGPADLTSFYNESLSSKDVHEMLEQFMGGSPEEFPQRYKLMSPVNHVNGSSPPTIIVHGEHDKVVPYDQSIALYHKLKNANVHAELYLLPASDHGFDFHWSGIGSQIAREKVRGFLHNYCR